MHLQVNRNQRRGRHFAVLEWPPAGIDGCHIEPRPTQPRRRRREAEWLPSELVSCQEKNPHSLSLPVHIRRYPYAMTALPAVAVPMAEPPEPTSPHDRAFFGHP